MNTQITAAAANVLVKIAAMGSSGCTYTDIQNWTSREGLDRRMAGLVIRELGDKLITWDIQKGLGMRSTLVRKYKVAA